jgi:nucleoside-diphosphate-sugar epimerase
MKALVTGATGFVGSHLVEALVNAGTRVTALVRSPHKAARLQALGVRRIAGDLHDHRALVDAAQDVDVIFHVAGLTAARDEAEFLHANRDGVRQLLQAARQAADRPRFVLVSSMAAGGPAPRGQPLTGPEPPRPLTAYGRSKLAGEDEVRASELPWTIVRPPMVYGPGDTEVLKLFRVVRAGLAPLFGDGSQELTAVFGPDLADALLSVIRSDVTIGRAYYVCHPEIVTSRALVHLVADALSATGISRPGRVRTLSLPEWLGRSLLTVTETAARLSGRATILTRDKANEFFQPAWTADPEPLFRDAGWRAAHDLQAGLALTARWYGDQGWL